jgi:SAM-dependent methyltransferase
MDFLASVGPDETVYDIGCGTGYWLEAALRMGIAGDRLVGVDLSPANVACVRAKGFKAACGNVLALGLEDDLADVVLCNGVIHHAPDPFRAFREVVRVTKPGGRIFLGVYNAWNPYFYLVHGAAAPARYIYWNWDRRILDLIWPLAKVIVQPLAYLMLGTFLDKRTGKTFLADQVMNPHAHLFSRAEVRRCADRCGCEAGTFGHTGAYMMLTAVIHVSKPRQEDGAQAPRRRPR